jgi:4-hydroxy-tetrahydrodipicolinate synthase
MTLSPYFGRVITAMVTPFTDGGQVNYAIAEALANHLVDHGSDALVICGTTGESPTLSWSEEYQLFKAIKSAVGDRAKIIAGTGSNCTAEAIEATQKASQLGLEGTLQVVPYYNKPPQAGLFAHFQAIARACPDIPLMLYNIPGRTGQNLQPETIAQLAAIDNIIAVKEASGSLEQASRIRHLTAPEFAIYAGDDFLTLPLMTVGGVGVVSVASHLVGDRLQRMIQSFMAGQVEEAIAINLSLSALFKHLFCMTNPIPVKAALQAIGWQVGSVRSPLCPLSPEFHDPLIKILKELNLLCEG